jgi:predicted negative regulator of RcsB-dependent stress response
MVSRNQVFMVRIQNFIEDNYKSFIALGCGCAVAALGFYFFMHHRTQQQEQAQLAYSETMYEIKRSGKNAELLPNAQLASQTGYRLYGNSSFGPYFLTAESQAFAQQGDAKKALEAKTQALKKMAKSSPVYTIFAIRQALMKLDSDDAAVQTEGLNELQTLASDKKNKQRDEALYYLGNYYSTHDDAQRAQDLWKELISDYSESADSAMSPWAMLVRKKI